METRSPKAETNMRMPRSDRYIVAHSSPSALQEQEAEEREQSGSKQSISSEDASSLLLTLSGT